MSLLILQFNENKQKILENNIHSHYISSEEDEDFETDLLPSKQKKVFLIYCEILLLLV